MINKWEIFKKQLITLKTRSAFYAKKWQQVDIANLMNWDDFQKKVPLLTKDELTEDQRKKPPYGSLYPYPIEEYTRFHQTSGSKGSPLRWLDTNESWGWVIGNWGKVLSAAGITRRDKVFFAFSFGPFLGFWSAFESAKVMGCLCFPGGGMSTQARIKMIKENNISVLCCTPTYAIKMGEVFQKTFGADDSTVEKILVAGEPGGSLLHYKEKISKLWGGAKVFDHHGMTEVGPVTFQTLDEYYDLEIITEKYFAEVIDDKKNVVNLLGEEGELVLSTIGREACPLIRYRTGDKVKRKKGFVEDRFVLEGGILGRMDDMHIIRGVNVYPAAIDDIVFSFPEIIDYQAIIFEKNNLKEMVLQIALKDSGFNLEKLAVKLNSLLHLRIPIEIIDQKELPEFEMKAKRWMVKNE